MSAPGVPLTKEQQIYADLLEEARIRLFFLRDSIFPRREDWPPRFFLEYCYLQYRLLCEFIAIFCLISHGDIKSRDALKAYKPPEIMRILEGLSTDFYPHAVRLIQDPVNKTL